ncbi:hypothetical protein XA68_16786 [Ophiocordyceps unilateralis]|uniref:Uncharacterized protein n=1 Tax=Ophiocordyceps unilateralis TaxID=268505 RepID=A0A2A9P5X0_OPHUN|nr:hypothetical protein XA68_16786 [Ophiocordyceps unilateralis]
MAGGDEAEDDEAGGDEAGGDEAGGDEAGGDEAGGDEAGGDKAGVSHGRCFPGEIPTRGRVKVKARTECSRRERATQCGDGGRVRGRGLRAAPTARERRSRPHGWSLEPRRH